jgi:hypothetical protein
MFEAEVEMERRSSFLPLVLMMCLAAAIVGLATYVLLQVRERTPLSAQQASGIVAATLRGPGPAIIHFRTGLVKPSTDVKPGILIIDYWKKQRLLNWPKRHGAACWSQSHR